GQIDIYLFDQLLRGRILPGMRILDAGCGNGRNLVYLLRTAAALGYQIFGADASAWAVQSVRQLAAELAPEIPPENFRIESLQAMSFADVSVDFVICSAVLHFAESDENFLEMLHGCWRLLVPGGMFFCRLASSIGTEHQIQPLGERRFLLPDGSERYLVDEAYLLELTRKLDAQLLDPLKTTVVQNQRSMTTWVLRKNAA
ncbi:MAG: Methyltransferase type 11, partial [Bryobacterales bacterium]|nr:Methyltransferase type 11 [Bryobacterales bacterium]